MLAAVLSTLGMMLKPDQAAEVKRVYERYRQTWWPSLKNLADKAEEKEALIEQQQQAKLMVVGNSDALDDWEDAQRASLNVQHKGQQDDDREDGGDGGDDGDDGYADVAW